MPTCKACSFVFPNHVAIDGKVRNLQRRLYCLACSPFDQHRTRPIGYIPTNGLLCVCQYCGKEYTCSRGRGHTRNTCNSCVSNRRRFSIKQRAIDLLGGQCKRCGYNRSSAALAFHHLDPKEKEFNISANHCRSWNVIEKEIKKCVLLCFNCHAEEHAKWRNAFLLAGNSVGKAVIL